MTAPASVSRPFPRRRNPWRHVGAAATLSLACACAFAQQGETVRIAWIDGLSGLTAPSGKNMLNTWQFMAERVSRANPAAVRFSIVPFDNKLSPQETVTLMQTVADQGIRYVAQGTGSGPAAAIIDFLNRYNERNPGKEIVYLNYAAVDPDLTNSRCSFWHFRLDADTSMKMEALTAFMKDEPSIRKVYLMNQNYAHGHQVAKFARQGLAQRRPDVQIVGEDLTPLAQVRDFAPYIAKIRASGADTVISGNWSSDLTLLVKAAAEAGLAVKFYTYYASATSTPSALGTGSADRVFAVTTMPMGTPPEWRRLMDEFHGRFDDDLSTTAPGNALALLAAAMDKARSTDPKKVAFALEGLSVKGPSGHDVTMRRADHQLQQALFIERWTRVGKAPLDYSVENTGMTFVPVRTLEPYVSSTPTSCQMKRPAG